MGLFTLIDINCDVLFNDISNKEEEDEVLAGGLLRQKIDENINAD